MSRAMAVILIFGSALGAMAESLFSHVVVNQRWPWSEKVDVDFVLSGETCDVNVTATWAGHPEPYVLGLLFDAAPGHNRLTWDPADSPFAGQTLAGFTVALACAPATVRRYLVVDLVHGGFSFLADVPPGGWTAEYKSSKMVFAKIPAGTYTLGETRATFEHLAHYNPSSISGYCNRRTVVFTSDFYVGVFKYTEAQHACLADGATSSSLVPQKISYEALRGATTADQETTVDWPSTGYKVSVGSVVDKLRKKTGGGLLVDLCEEEQWEAAARAGASTIWPNGGELSDDLDTLTGYLNQLAAWKPTGATADTPVGTKSANDYGLYDVCGLGGEWTLDKARNNGSVPYYGLSDSVDPKGADDNAYTYRVLRNANGINTTESWQLLPCRRQMAAPTSASFSTRFCIHLKPLVN